MKRLFRFGWKVWKAPVELDIFEYGPLQKVGNIGYRKVFVKKVGNGVIFPLDQV